MKEMHLHLKCRARFDEKMKSRRQPEKTSVRQLVNASHTALRRQSGSRDKLIPKLSPRLS